MDLSTGSLLSLYTSSQQSIGGLVLQVIDIGVNQTGEKERYRIVLSDGECYMQSMVVTPLNHLFKERHIVPNSIVQILEYMCNSVSENRKILIVMNIEHIRDEEYKIGEPLQIEQVLYPQQPQQNPPQYQQSQIQPQPQQQPQRKQPQHQPQLQHQPPQLQHQPLKQQHQQPPQQQHQPPKQQHQQPQQLQHQPKQQLQQHQPQPQPQQWQYQKKQQSQQSQSIQPSQRQPMHQPPNQPSNTVDDSNLLSNIIPIASLSQYQRRWTIKARVTYKSSVHPYSNSRGDGRILSIELVDNSGEIKAIMFNEAVDTFSPILEVGKVYFISKASIKKANKASSYSVGIRNDYEITLQDGTMVIPVLEDTADVPYKHYSFVTVGDIKDIPTGKVVDILAVLINNSELVEVPSKRDPNTILLKRDLTLVDDSYCSIGFTLWDENARNFNSEGFPVIAIKSVRVTDFKGKSLSAGRSTRWEFNPDLPRTQELQKWFHSQEEMQVENLTQNEGSFSGNVPWMSLKEAKQEAFGKEIPSYFLTKGTIMIIKHDDNTTLYYPACPKEKCNKKVTINESTNTWFCTKCNQNYPNCDLRYILPILVADESMSEWCTGFNEVGCMLLGRDANQIKMMRDRSDPEFSYIVRNATYGQYIFKIKANEEIYMDQPRVKFTVVAMDPVNYVGECQELLKKIAALNNQNM